MDAGPIGYVLREGRAMTRVLAVHDYLRWAFRDELPKAEAPRGFLRPASFGTPWGAVTKTGLQGMEVDEPDVRNRFGVVPDLTATRDPHPDAIEAWVAVEKLADLPLSIPEGWYPLADLGDLGPYGPAAVRRALQRLCVINREGQRLLRRSAADLIRKHAILGNAPVWKAEKPEFRTVNASNGRPKWFRRMTIETSAGAMESEVDGFDHKRRLPYNDAYLKHYYDPDPAGAAEARAEYEIWRTALDEIYDDVRNRLEDTVLRPCDLPHQPWDEPERREPRILPAKNVA